eukprot:CAMPEP_0182437400 /NCGR_PEP_ID=MMETSP1167-20130531/85016_1 /TAXON_ID=2988 /ORGANISM="Mallomonas Sp, Strain CCMP3275" /LENGTH=560 /DNA_ID=CAMNT_0024630305 /DNA_START=848 /DNA_END=2530 /DNA_ORIENTATION=-
MRVYEVFGFTNTPTTAPTVPTTAPTSVPTSGSIFSLNGPLTFTGSSGLFYNQISESVYGNLAISMVIKTSSADKIKLFNTALSADRMLALYHSSTLSPSRTPTSFPSAPTLAPTLAASIFSLNGPLSFTGSSGVMYDPISANVYHNLAISMVIKTSSAGSVLMSLGRAPDDNERFFHFMIAGGQKLLFFDYLDSTVGFGFTTSRLSDGSVPVDERAHVGFVKAGTSGTYYINGVAAGVASGSISFPFFDDYLGIGYNPLNGGQQYVGSMDNIKLYNVALSADKMLDLYRTSVTNSPTATPSNPTVIPTVAPTIAPSTAQPTVPTVTPTRIPTYGPVFENIAQINFNGTYGYFHDTVDISYDLSICLALEMSSSSGMLVSLGRHPTSDERYFHFLVSDRRLHFYDYLNSAHGTGFAAGQINNYIIPQGERIHIGFVKSGTTGTYYVNGLAIGTITARFSVDYFNHYLGIGYNPYDGGQHFVGLMDNIKLFSIALSPERMITQYFLSTPAPTSTPTTIPTTVPTVTPTTDPTVTPTTVPTVTPTTDPTVTPTTDPSSSPTPV